MPKLVGKKVFNASSGTGDISTPVNIVNDYVFLVVDPEGFTLNSSGFTTLVSGAMNIYYQKISTPITSINITLVNSVRDAMALFVFRGVHGTDPFDGLTPSIAASSSGSGQAVTSATANTLAITVASDNLEQAIYDYPWETIAIGKNSSYRGLSVGMLPMPSSGTTPTPFLPAYASNAFSSCTFVLRDDGTNLQHGYHDHSAAKAGVILGLNDGIGDTDWTAAHTTVSSVTNAGTSFTCDGGISQVLNATQTIGVHRRRAVRVDTGTSGNTTYKDKVLANGYQIPSFDAQGKVISLVIAHDDTGEYQTEIGAVVGLSDGTNTRIWHASAVDTQPRRYIGEYPFVFEVQGGYELEDQGTVDATALGAIDNFWFGFYSVDRFQVLKLGTLFELNAIPLSGGTTADTISYADAYRLAQANDLQTVQAQGGQSDGQYLFFQSLTLTGLVHFDATSQSAVWAEAPDQDSNKPQCLVTEGTFNHTIDVDANSTINLAGVPIDMGNYGQFGFASTTSTTGTTYNLTGAAIRRAVPLLNTVAISGATFFDCKEATFTTLSDMSGGSIFDGCVAAQQITVTSKADFEKLQNCTFRNCTALAIQITGNQTGTWSATGMTVSGGAGSYDIEYTGTTDFTIEFDIGSGFIQGRVDNSAAVTAGNTGLIVSTPTQALRINPDVNITGSIRYFDGSPDDITPNGSGTGDFLDYTYSTTDPIDIEVVEQGYVPVNQQNVTPFNGTLTIEMDIDEAYNASHSLTIVTHYTYKRATKAFAILADQNAFDVRSSMADTIRLNSSYFNTPLLLEAKPGGKRIDLIDGATITSMATWKGAGMERYDAADAINPVEKWYAIQSVNNIAGSAVVYRQTNSGDFTVGSLTNNVFDETLQFYSDPDHDGTPATENNSYLLIKALRVGYRQARNDVVAGNGGASLKADLYTIGLNPESHSYAGNPVTDLSLTMTLVAGGTVGGKTFAYKWVDGGTNSGTDIADWINYKGATDPNGLIPGSTGLRWAEMPDMVIYNGSEIWTANGYREGATPTLVGFYVERGGADHPDFAKFESDTPLDFYTPATSVQVLAPNLIDGTLVVVADLDNPGTWLDDGTVVSGGGGYSLVLPFTGNKNIQIRAGHTSKRIVKENLLLTSGGATYLGTPAADEFYAHHAIDGSTVTGYALDYIFNEIDVVVPDVFNALQGYAWYKYKMMTDATALKRFAGLLDYLSLGHLRFDDVSIDPIVGTALDVKFDNITSPPKEIVESSGIRVDRASGTRPVRTPTTSDAGIDVDWRSDVYVALVTTSDQSLNLATAEQALANTGVTSTRMAELDSIPVILADTAEMQPKVAETHQRLDLDAAKPNTYADNGTSIANADYTLTKTNNGDGTSTVQRS